MICYLLLIDANVSSGIKFSEVWQTDPLITNFLFIGCSILHSKPFFTKNSSQHWQVNLGVAEPKLWFSIDIYLMESSVVYKINQALTELFNHWNIHSFSPTSDIQQEVKRWNLPSYFQRVWKNSLPKDNLWYFRNKRSWFKLSQKQQQKKVSCRNNTDMVL